MSSSKNRALSIRVWRVRFDPGPGGEARPGSLNPMWPSVPMPRICRSTPPASAIASSYCAQAAGMSVASPSGPGRRRGRSRRGRRRRCRSRCSSAPGGRQAGRRIRQGEPAGPSERQPSRPRNARPVRRRWPAATTGGQPGERRRVYGPAGPRWHRRRSRRWPPVLDDDDFHGACLLLAVALRRNGCAPAVTASTAGTTLPRLTFVHDDYRHDRAVSGGDDGGHVVEVITAWPAVTVSPSATWAVNRPVQLHGVPTSGCTRTPTLSAVMITNACGSSLRILPLTGATASMISSGRIDGGAVAGHALGRLGSRNVGQRDRASGDRGQDQRPTHLGDSSVPAGCAPKNRRRRPARGPKHRLTCWGSGLSCAELRYREARRDRRSSKTQAHSRSRGSNTRLPAQLAATGQEPDAADRGAAAAGILLRLGRDDLLGRIKAPVIGPFFQAMSAAGSALFTNLPLLFAVVAGFAPKADGSTRAVGGRRLPRHAGRVQDHVAVRAGRSARQGRRSGRSTTACSGGIVIGLVTAAPVRPLRHQTSGLSPGFFGGRRFVPIVVSLASLVIAFAMSYFYPVFDAGLARAGAGHRRFGCVGRLRLRLRQPRH